jgi:hypothetical protein
MDPETVDEAIERWMRDRPAPSAPADFTAAVMSRVRRERWKSERYWDLAFNTAVVAGLVLVVGGIFGLVYMSGLAAVGRDAALLFAASLQTTADQLAPQLPVYLGGLLLTASALGLWWWAEN